MAASPVVAKKANTKLIAVGVVVVLLAAYFLVFKPKPAVTPTPGAGVAITAGNVKLADIDNIPHDGPVVALDSITVNLADGKLLRVGVALQLGKAAAKEGSVDPRSFGA